jgi:alanyl-tRNA synthetase
MGMTSAEIRRRYLDFFKSKGHTVVESDLLVPLNDPTLLFTGAGMNQFKEQFMGRNITYTRAASCQKCLRTGDLENVGKTPRHHTFFEMLGNFSFGDYFKKEAIQWAWEFMTEEMALPKEKLWVSVYEYDEESYNIWLNEMRVPVRKIVKLGEHDNFWPADAPTKGPNGPCGPCSEIFYDWGEGKGCGKDSCNPACDCGRFVEIWNLVFTQFDRKPDGSLAPLPNKNIDTGMGLERMASVMQGVRTNFETDLFVPMTGRIRAGIREEPGTSNLNLIVDHIRAVTFAICDGVSPSNEKRGYVVRKLIRRAYLKSRSRTPFLYNLVPVVVDVMKDVYPELGEKREHISAIVKEEEKRFNDTLEAALPVLEEMLASGATELTGEQVFKLVDTYGLPIDVIEEKAEVPLDMEGFEKLMEQRKEQSRRGSDITCDFIFSPDFFADAPNPGCSDELPLRTKLEFMLKGEEVCDEAKEGDCVEVITSPQSGRLYAVAGGQVGDTGSIVKPGAEMDIVNTLDVDGRKVLQAVVKKGSFARGDEVTLEVDSVKKMRTACNHTATHLLQAALRGVLGSQVKQSGSYVDDKRLRFDFTHMKKLSDRELARVEDMVNGWIEEGVSVCKEMKKLEEAKGEGALSFFGEKYEDTVRVVSVGEYSKELCGGTHVDNTAEICVFKIINESSVASGIRRIEALTGENAVKWIKETLEGLLEDCRRASGGDPGIQEEVAEYVDGLISGKTRVTRSVIRDFDEKIRPVLMETRERLERDAKKDKKKKQAEAFDQTKAKIDGFVKNAVRIGEVNFISGIIEDAGMELLRKCAGYLEKKMDSGVVLLGGDEEGKAFLICAVTPDLADKGVDARKIMDRASKSIGGGGGGKPTFAQAGGKDPGGLREAIEQAKKFIGGKE